MDWKIRNIRLREIQNIYLEKLKVSTYNLYEPLLQREIVRSQELDENIMQYYNQTQPSLQEFYSHYAPQWERFYESNELPDAAFLRFLENMAYPLQMKYSMGDLNVKYYIERFRTLKKRSREWKQLREFFFEKWHNLLANNEYNFQVEHIDALCQTYFQMQKAIADELPQRGNTRLMWLLRNRKELVEQLFVYDETIRTHPAVRELKEILGREHEGRRKRFGMMAGLRREQVIDHSAKSDIIGICEGNDLNCLLPIEYCYLSDPLLSPLFFERFAEKKLQMIDYESKTDRAIRDVKVPGHDVAEEREGPFIVCVDTSGSMSGWREEIAKSVIVAIAGLVEQQNRRCYIINFSDDIACIEIDNLGKNIQELGDFLCQSFHGGTDVAPAIDHAIHQIRTADYRNADLVMLSDFEMPAMNEELSSRIDQIKSNDTRIYAFAMGKYAEKSYLDICNKYWLFD